MHQKLWKSGSHFLTEVYFEWGKCDMDHKKSEILLETGTNEIEIMQFTINDILYGINVAKVREIMMSAPVHAMPHSHPAVEGIFKPRDIVITVIDLPKFLSRQYVEKG